MISSRVFKIVDKIKYFLKHEQKMKFGPITQCVAQNLVRNPEIGV